MKLSNFKFYLKDKETGELEVKLICKDCGLEMDETTHYIAKAKCNVVDPFTVEFKCDECFKKNGWDKSYNN